MYFLFYADWNYHIGPYIEFIGPDYLVSTAWADHCKLYE